MFMHLLTNPFVRWKKYHVKKIHLKIFLESIDKWFVMLLQMVLSFLFNLRKICIFWRTSQLKL